MEKNGEKDHFFGEYVYDTGNPKAIQTFSVQNEAGEGSGKGVYTLIKVRIMSNYGGDSTCIYRFRVHGDRKEF